MSMNEYVAAGRGVLGDEGKTAPTMYPKPSVGRIVHYYLSHGDVGRAVAQVHGRKPQAAIVLEVMDDDPSRCNLQVFGTFWANITPRRVPYSETPKAGHWSWPPRV